jgi:hypothetical protein
MVRHRLRVVEGRPWQKAVLCALEPEAPFDPWDGVEDVVPGDGVIVLIDTTPRTVLCAFTLKPDNDVRGTIARKCRFNRVNLQTVTRLEQAAGGYSLEESVGLPVDSPAAVALLATVGEWSPSSPADRVGKWLPAVAGIVLQSAGRCTCCGQKVDLNLAHRASVLSVHLVSPADFLSGRDWPSALCPECVAAMKAADMTSVVEFAFSREPACPVCSAKRTQRVSYGMSTHTGYVNKPPWEKGAGCVVDSQGRWSCSACEHTWGSVMAAGTRDQERWT